VIIDAHTHLFPPEVIADVEGFRRRDTWFHDAFAAPGSVFATPDSMIAEMDSAGVDVAIVAGWPWRDQGICRAHNAWLAETCVASGGRLQWLGIVNPAGSGAVSTIHDCVSTGAVGLGEINADAQEFDWRATGRVRDAVATAIDAELPWMIHASEPTGHVYPGKGTATPDRLVHFIMEYPELNVVAAHWGGGLPFYELMPEVRSALQNVTYDSAATTYLYRHDVFDAVARIVGPDKVLFGSDYPMLGMTRLLRRVRQLELDHAAILGGNAARVYGIGEK
jgi:predicted TIM-barrel fold metal-dependent hydrolase